MGCGGRRHATLESEWKWNQYGAPYPVHAKKIHRWGVVPHGMGITVTWAWRDRPEYYYLLELSTVQSHPKCCSTVWSRAASLYFSLGNTAANTTLPTSPPNALFSGRECALGTLCPTPRNAPNAPNANSPNKALLLLVGWSRGFQRTLHNSSSAAPAASSENAITPRRLLHRLQVKTP